MPEIGIKGKQERIVTDEMTAKNVGSGELEVLATPSLIALAEETAWKSVAGEMEPGKGTVGTMMTLNHRAATPVGMKVWCETELTGADGRKLTFELRAYDENGPVADGSCERFIVDNKRFLEKAYRSKTEDGK